MLDNGLVMYIHPTCATSYSIIKYLNENNLINKIKIINTSNISHIPGFKIWSVPWIIYKGRPIATDPVNGEEVEALINNDRIEVRNPIEAFMNTVLHSALASSISLLHASIEPVIDRDLLEAATRGTLSDTGSTKIISEISSRSRELYSEWRNKLVRALAISFVRDLWWGSGGRLEFSELQDAASTTYLSTWLIAKAGIGRVALPSNPLLFDREALEDMARFIMSSARGLVRKIEREQETILNDNEYWRIIDRVTQSV